MSELDDLYTPGKGTIRTTNKLKKGYLKRSLFLSIWEHISKYKPHQGKKECERRVRQLMKGERQCN